MSRQELFDFGSPAAEEVRHVDPRPTGVPKPALEGLLRKFVAKTRPFVLVPHGVFLQWSAKQQLAYCAARDRDSARVTGEAGYDERAALYEGDMEAL